MLIPRFAKVDLIADKYTYVFVFCTIIWEIAHLIKSQLQVRRTQNPTESAFFEQNGGILKIRGHIDRRQGEHLPVNGGR